MAIIVLSERAEELSSVAEELDQLDPLILSEVLFFAGVARNPEHLKMCGVERARAVAIIRSPVAVTGSSQDTSDITESAVVDADMQTIMTSLNLHMILQKSLMRRRYDKLRRNLCQDADLLSTNSSGRARQGDAHGRTFTGASLFT